MLRMMPPDAKTLRRIAREMQVVELAPAPAPLEDPYRPRTVCQTPRAPDPATELVLTHVGSLLGAATDRLQKLAWLPSDRAKAPAALRALEGVLSGALRQLRSIAELDLSERLTREPELIGPLWAVRRAIARLLEVLAANVQIFDADLEPIAAGARPSAEGSLVDRLVEWSRERSRPRTRVAKALLDQLSELVTLTSKLAAPAPARLPEDPALLPLDPFGRDTRTPSLAPAGHLFEAARLARAIGDRETADELCHHAFSAILDDDRASPPLAGLAALRRADLHLGNGRFSAAEADYTKAAHAFVAALGPTHPLPQAIRAIAERREPGPFIDARRALLDRAIAALR